jgi:hypothetical protein
MLRRILVVLIVTYFQVRGEIAYGGYKVYDIKVKNEDELTLLKNFDDSEGEKRELDFFSLHNNVNDQARLMVKPSEQKFVEEFFKNNNLDFKIVTNDVSR